MELSQHEQLDVKRRLQLFSMSKSKTAAVKNGAKNKGGKVSKYSFILSP